MTTIPEVRKKFPQYNDMSDQELADALHGKFYSDIPKDKFYKDIGLVTEQPKVEQPKVEKPSLLQNAMQGVELVNQFHPIQYGVRKAGEAMGGLMERLDKAAYGLGGKVTDVAAGAGLPPEVAAGAGYATNVATQAIPTILGGEAAKLIGSPTMKAAGQRVMQAALKPTAANLVGGQKSKAAQAIRTLLDEGVNVTPSGAARLRAEISRLNKEVKNIIAKSSGVVDRQKVGAEVLNVLDDVSKQATPGASIKAVEKVFDEFMNHPLIKGDKIPVQLAQDIKRATQKVLADDFGQLSGAEKTAQKAIAAGLRKGIEEVAPDVAKLNAKESQLLNALTQAEGRAGIAGNQNIGGLSFLATNPAAAAAFMADRSSLFKSILARLLYSGSRTVPGAVGSGATAAYEASTQNP